MSITTLTAKQLRRAADIKERIDVLQDELNEILGNGASAPDADTEKPGRRRFSAATRARMRLAQKARWAKLRGVAPKRRLSAEGLANIRAGVLKRLAAQGKATGPKAAGKVKRKFSAAGKAALSAAAKARWAKARAAGKARL